MEFLVGCQFVNANKPRAFFHRYSEQSDELGSRIWQLTEQLSQAKSDGEKSSSQLRIIKRSRDDEATVAAAEIQLLKNKIDNMSSTLK